MTSDLLDAWDGDIRWSLETLGGEVLASGEEEAELPPLASNLVCTLDFSDRLSDENIRDVIFVAELWQGDERAAVQVASFVPTKHLSLTDPGLTVNTRGVERHAGDRRNLHLAGAPAGAIVRGR